jgi:hypothetical protein
MVLRWVANCTPRRVDMPAKRGLRGITRCRLHNGKIAETWTVWDSRTGVVGLGTLRQKLSRG